jgi:hypothetical protein
VGLAELHVDGGYGSGEADQALAEEEIALIQTAIKGPDPAVQMNISQTGESWQVSCPRQSVPAQRTRKRWKAEFDLAVCKECPLADQCPATEGKSARRWYFTPEDAARHRRWRRLQALPTERQTLRANVEATVRQMQGAMAEGKLKVRGLFKTQCYGLLRAIGVNLGRIARNIADPETEASLQALVKALLRFFIPDRWLFAYLPDQPRKTAPKRCIFSLI